MHLALFSHFVHIHKSYLAAEYQASSKGIALVLNVPTIGPYLAIPMLLMKQNTIMVAGLAVKAFNMLQVHTLKINSCTHIVIN